MIQKITSYHSKLLWQQFENHCKEKWAFSFKKLGPNEHSLKAAFGEYQPLLNIFNATEKKTFLSNLQEFISAEIFDRKNELKAPSYNTLSIILNSQSFSQSPKEKTIAPFLFILKYKNLEDFKVKNPEIEDEIVSIEKKEIFKETDNTTGLKVTTLQKSYFRLWLVLFVAFLMIALIYFFGKSRYLASNPNNTDLMAEFEKVINETNRYHLDAYTKLPIIDTSKVDTFYTKNSVAKRQFIKVLLNSKDSGRILRPELSHFSVNKLDSLERINESKYRVKVDETWYIIWKYNTQIRPQLKYDETNIQTYIFELEKDVWKINVNDYKGEAKPLVN